MSFVTNPALANEVLRHDPALGVIEKVGFLPSDGGDIFATFSLPAVAKGALVVCCSLYEDFMRNYRREVLLSRRLAARGFAVARFHYRGSGNSQGDPRGLAFDGMVADAGTVGRFVRELVNSPSVAYLGTRLGALVAAAASAAGGAAPLALWEPVIRPTAYFREAFMASTIRDVKRDVEGGAPMQALIDTLRSEGSVDLLGYTLTRSLHDDLASRSLPEEIGVLGRPVLLVQIASERRLSGTHERLAATLTSVGCDVVVDAVEAEQSWWFTGGAWKAEEARDGSKALIELTGDWLSDVERPSA
jgi:pimeloyl-ACP methyl ester carboxylesterase